MERINSGIVPETGEREEMGERVRERARAKERDSKRTFQVPGHANDDCFDGSGGDDGDP